MVILGFNSFHADSAACLLVDGKLVSAVAEERLGQRIKHDSSFPANAIRRVLFDSNLSLRDVSYVAIARDPGANLSAKFKYVSKNASDFLVIIFFSLSPSQSIMNHCSMPVEIICKLPSIVF